MRKWNVNTDTDILIIKSKDELLTEEELYKELKLDYNFSRYNYSANEWVDIPDKTVLEISDYYDEDYMNYTSEDGFKILTTPRHRLLYALACFYNDDKITEVMHNKFPRIETIEVNCRRSASKPYLKHWMDMYGFTLEDFIFNNKYVIMSEGGYFSKILDKLVVNSLLKEDDGLITSIDELYYASDEWETSNDD